jgi:hypothetical protein
MVAKSGTSTFHTMALKDVFKRDGTLLSVTNAPKASFRKIHIFQILEMLQYGFADVEALRASGAPGQFLETRFHGLWN